MNRQLKNIRVISRITKFLNFVLQNLNFRNKKCYLQEIKTQGISSFQDNVYHFRNMNFVKANFKILKNRNILQRSPSLEILFCILLSPLPLCPSINSQVQLILRMCFNGCGSSPHQLKSSHQELKYNSSSSILLRMTINQ